MVAEWLIVPVVIMPFMAIMISGQLDEILAVLKDIRTLLKGGDD